MKEKSLKIIISLMTISVIGIIVIQFYWITKALKLEEETFSKNVGIALSETVKLIEKNETANIIVRELSNDDDDDILFLNRNKNMVDSLIRIDTARIIKKFVTNKSHNNNFNVEVETNDDSLSNSVKVISNIQFDGDSTVQETFVWNSDVDSLIHRKTKIIENVFDELVLSKHDGDIAHSLNRNKIDSILSEELTKYGIRTDYNFAIKVDEKDSLLLITENANIPELITSSYKAKLFPSNYFGKPNYLLVDFTNKSRYFLSSIWLVLLVSLIFTVLIIYLFYYTVKMLIRQKKITEIKNDLLNNITHEFKTPISTITLAADVIGTEGISAAGKYTKIIKSEGKRLTNMVEDILSAAALEKSEYELNKEKKDIHLIINDVIEKFKLPINIKNGEIKTNFEASNSVLYIDKQQIFNSISNIIDNAIKYNNGSPKITIQTVDTNNAFEIIFEDNGIGIDLKNQNKIFETFYRVPTGNIHNVKGNGIGLSYVKKIIEAHGGTVKVVSELNKGSKFIINLPKF